MKISCAHGMGCCKSILASLGFFMSLINFEGKNGSRVFSWHDVWCGEQALKIQFPNLLRMALPKDATMHDVSLGKLTKAIGTLLFQEAPVTRRRIAFAIFWQLLPR